MVEVYEELWNFRRISARGSSGHIHEKKDFLFQIKRLLKSLEGQKDARYYFAILNWRILNGTQGQHIYKLPAILLYLLCLIKQEILPNTPHNFLELGIKQFM